MFFLSPVSVVNFLAYLCNVQVLRIYYYCYLTMIDLNRSEFRYSRPRGIYSAHMQYNSVANILALLASAHRVGNRRPDVSRLWVGVHHRASYVRDNLRFDTADDHS